MIRALFATAMLAAPGAAWACGGFFCNNTAPVDQAGEDVFFAVDAASGTVTMHVQVEYEGPSEDFAWIVPVGAVPEIEVSSPALFSLLSAQLSPVFSLIEEREGTCAASDSYLEDADTDADSDADFGYSTTSTNAGVQIIDSGEVGPYETVTLLADSSQALLDWLNANGYDLPPALDPVLAPYVASGQYFVALKLQKDKDAGDLTPLALTYAGDKASIPVQLTSVAATPDMRLRVTIAGPARAVPESYLHLELNPFAIDWWTGGSNYDEVVTRAAKQAGAHGFATDYSGVPGAIPGLYSELWDTAELAAAATSVVFLQTLQADGYPADQTLRDILDAWVQVPPELEGDRQSIYNCPTCYEAELTALPFDAPGAAADVEAQIVAPRRALSDLFQSGVQITRLTSSLSPEDMTVDPVFGFNAGMPEVPRVRTATLHVECNPAITAWEANRRLSIGTFPDLLLPPSSFLWERAITEHEYILSLHEPANEHVAKTAESGDPSVVRDNHPEIVAKIIAFNDEHGSESTTTCGCATPGWTGAGWAALALGVAGLRRRRRSNARIGGIDRS